jgi:hypothetical protein
MPFLETSMRCVTRDQSFPPGAHCVHYQCLAGVTFIHGIVAATGQFACWTAYPANSASWAV